MGEALEGMARWLEGAGTEEEKARYSKGTL